jgi:GxxExxY protein
MALIYEQESYVINGAAMDVYNQLGHGFLEAVYQEAFERELKIRGIPYEREKELTIKYKGEVLKQKYKADFVCYGKIIVELKAVSDITDAHRSQVYNYLHATRYKLGLLFNFGYYDGLERNRIICN